MTHLAPPRGFDAGPTKIKAVVDGLAPMRRWTTLAAVLILTAFSGCLDDGSDAALGPESTPAGTALADRQPTPGSGDAATHGDPQVTVEPTETGRDILMAYAVQRGAITNDFGGASFSMTSFEVGSGDIAIGPSPDGDYHILYEITAYALTEGEAERMVEAYDVVHEDTLLDNGTLKLKTTVGREDAYGPLRISMGGASIRLEVLLPTGPFHGIAAFAGSGDVGLHDLDATQATAATGSGDIAVRSLRAQEILADSGSGRVALTDITAAKIALATSSGDITAEDVVADRVAMGTGSGDVRILALQAAKVNLGTSSGDITGEALDADALKAETGSGHIQIDGALGGANVSTSSGDVDLQLEPVRSGTFAMGAGSGDLRLLFDGLDERHGVSVRADTASGDITVDLPGAENRTQDDHLELTTPGFDERPIQLLVEAGTSSGDIHIASNRP